MGRLPENTRGILEKISAQQRSDEAERARMDIETRGMGTQKEIDAIEYARKKETPYNRRLHDENNK